MIDLVNQEIAYAACEVRTEMWLKLDADSRGRMRGSLTNFERRTQFSSDTKAQHAIADFEKVNLNCKLKVVRVTSELIITREVL